MLLLPERCLTPTKHCVYNNKARQTRFIVSHGVFPFRLLPFHLLPFFNNLHVKVYLELGLLQAVELQADPVLFLSLITVNLEEGTEAGATDNISG